MKYLNYSNNSILSFMLTLFIKFKRLLFPYVTGWMISYNGFDVITLAAASEAVPPCLKRDHGARSSI